LLHFRGRRACWLALAAMLALAVLPVASQAIALARGNALPADVCTAPGSRPAADGAPIGHHHPSADCVQCGSACGSPGLPPASLWQALDATAGDARRAITRAANPNAAARHRVQARAPPTRC
jgi:hypothetical protein